MSWLSSAEEAKARTPDVTSEFARVRQQGGPGPWGLFLRLLALRLRRSRLQPMEYLDYGLWRPGLSRAEVAAYLPNRSRRALNDSLRDRRHPQMDAIIEDKLATLVHLVALGLPVAPVAAVFRAGVDGDAPPPGVPLLADRAALVAFLSDLREPLFGKPLHASWARGAVAITGPGAGPGTLRLGDGRDAPVADLADEIVESYGAGYLLQPRLRIHPELRAHLGEATGSLRLVTLRGPQGPEILYAVQKCPAAGAMHDGPARGDRAWALVDPEDGKVLRLRRYRDPAGPDLTHWQNPAAPLVGSVLPHFAAARALARAGHEAMPGHGILGWDIFLTEAGAIISEVNANPDHGVYQQAARQGLLSPEFRARLAAARALAAA